MLSAVHGLFRRAPAARVLGAQLARSAAPLLAARAPSASFPTAAGLHATAAARAGESPIYKHASMLGKNTPIPTTPEDATLDRVPNPRPGTQYLVRFTCPEFTSICPVTGAPDFCHLVIDYVPRDFLVESKSLKLYLGSFRNHGAFHEECTVMVGQRLVKELDCIWLRVGGYWYPRGGIPIDVFFQTGPPPPGVWIPDQGVPPYRGRG